MVRACVVWLHQPGVRAALLLAHVQRPRAERVHPDGPVPGPVYDLRHSRRLTPAGRKQCIWSGDMVGRGRDVGA